MPFHLVAARSELLAPQSGVVRRIERHLSMCPVAPLPQPLQQRGVGGAAIVIALRGMLAIPTAPRARLRRLRWRGFGLLMRVRGLRDLAIALLDRGEVFLDGHAGRGFGLCRIANHDARPFDADMVIVEFDVVTLPPRLSALALPLLADRRARWQRA